MDQDGRTRGGVGHRRAPYSPPGPRSTSRRGPRPAAASLLGLLLLLGLASGAEAARPRAIDATARWRSFRIGRPEEVVVYRLPVTAGCRYRITVEGRTLPRPIVEVGPGEAVLWRDDAGLAPEEPAEEPADEAAAEAGPPVAEVDFFAERDQVVDLRVRGFSASTGKGRVRVETLDAVGRRVEAHHRVLHPGTTPGQVGELWVGEPNDWEVVVQPGATYRISTRPGTAGRVRLVLRAGPRGAVLARADPDGATPWPDLRFEAPGGGDGLGGGTPRRLHLEVEAVDHGGGTYGLRLDEVHGRPPEPPPPPPPPVETGVVDAEAGLFQANPGDLAFVHVPACPPMTPHHLMERRDGAWQLVPYEGSPTIGMRGTMRTPENAALAWFRPHRSGTFRFLERADAHLQVIAAEALPSAPVLVGTGHDPQVHVAPGGTWTPVAIGVCMPGWPYLYVAVTRRPGAVALRVRTLDGDTLGYRPAGGEGLGRVAGMGPSMRFRVEVPQVVVLEAKARSWEGSPLLRRAAN